MSGLKFEDDAMLRLEALYRSADMVARREGTLKLLDLKSGEHVLDVGSGPGILSEQMADAVGPGGRVHGIELSEPLVARATARNDRDWLTYSAGDAAALAEPNAAYDAVVCVQVAEYVKDVDAVCTGIARTMKPGGRGLIVTTDWGALVWHSDDPERMRRMAGAFEGHCAHPHLPPVLAPLLRDAGLSVDRVSINPQVNLEWSDDGYSKHLAGFFRGYAMATEALPADEITAWYDELSALSVEGRYFYALSSFNFEVSRPTRSALS